MILILAGGRVGIKVVLFYQLFGNKKNWAYSLSFNLTWIKYTRCEEDFLLLSD
jgi:hypothetical protein